MTLPIKIDPRRHGLAPLLYVAEKRAEFAPDYRRTLAQNMNFLRVTLETLALFRNEGIEPMPLKGALFASRYWPDLGTRPQSDVDVLVRPKDLAHAHAALVLAGWREAVPRAFYKGHYHWVYEREDAGLLELHWALKPEGTGTPDLKRVWAEARVVHAEGADFLEMRREDLLEYLAVNKAVQHYATLGDFYDLDRIVAAGPLDWDRLVAQAVHDGVCGAVWFGLAHCREYFGTPVPAAALAALARRPSTLGARALKTALDAVGGTHRAPSALFRGALGRVHEAVLEGRPAAAARLLTPLVRRKLRNF